MSNSKRQTLLDYLAATILSSTTIAIGNGYNFTIKKSERGLKSKNELTGGDVPAIFIASADEKIENNKTGKGMLVTLTAYIYGLVAEDPSTLKVQSQLDLLIEDVKKALLADPSFGGRCNGTFPKEVITDEGDQHPYAMFRMTVEILYTGTYLAP